VDVYPSSQTPHLNRISFGLQLAHAAGATVIATSSSDEKLEIAKKLGATHLINYKNTPEWGDEALKLVTNPVPLCRGNLTNCIDGWTRRGSHHRSRWPRNPGPIIQGGSVGRMDPHHWLRSWCTQLSKFAEAIYLTAFLDRAMNRKESHSSALESKLASEESSLGPLICEHSYHTLRIR
jgi:hypothetical protein